MNRTFRMLFFLSISLLLPAGTARAAPDRNLPKRLLVGYWHNWMYSPNSFKLTEISSDFDVIDVAFAVPSAPGGATLQFQPDPGIYPNVQEFKDDVQALHAQGKKVLISIGGANGTVHVQNASDVQQFVSSMKSIIDTYGFDGMDIDLEGTCLYLDAGDTDFKHPKSPKIVHFIEAVIQLTDLYPQGFMLTAAPETAYVQGGFSLYGGIWGTYLPVIHALRDRLTFIHVQHYNTGSMCGRDGKIYTPATADFHCAMADMLLAGFPVAGNGAYFDPLAPEQVLIGLPASPKAAGTGYTSPGVVQEALDYLILGKPFGGQYVLGKPDGYFDFRGLMTWSVNWDADNGYLFSTTHRAYLDGLDPHFLEADTDTLSAAAGGQVHFTLAAGAAQAHRTYLLLGSVSGTDPGTPLPGGTVLPLNWDLFTGIVLSGLNTSGFHQFFALLDSGGNGQALLDTQGSLDPACAGLTLYFAYAVRNHPWFASNAVAVVIVP